MFTWHHMHHHPTLNRVVVKHSHMRVDTSAQRCHHLAFHAITAAEHQISLADSSGVDADRLADGFLMAARGACCQSDEQDERADYFPESIIHLPSILTRLSLSFFSLPFLLSMYLYDTLACSPSSLISSPVISMSWILPCSP